MKGRGREREGLGKKGEGCHQSIHGAWFSWRADILVTFTSITIQTLGIFRVKGRGREREGLGKKGEGCHQSIHGGRFSWCAGIPVTFTGMWIQALGIFASISPLFIINLQKMEKVCEIYPFLSQMTNFFINFKLFSYL